MGAAKHFFDNKDLNKRLKAQIYVSCPLNALLWGYKTWNLTKCNLNKLVSFHHSAIRQILGIRWDQVKEKHIKNRGVRGLLCNILYIEAYIVKRTATYIRKISSPAPRMDSSSKTPSQLDAGSGLAALSVIDHAA